MRRLPCPPLVVVAVVAALALLAGARTAVAAGGGGKSPKAPKGGATAPASAAAPPMHDAARSFFQAGQALYEKGKFAEAAKAFQSAFDEEPLAALAYNAAQSWDRAGDRAMAIAAYRKYLGFKESESDAEQVKARLAVLEKEAAAPVATAPRHTPLPYKEPVTGHVYQTFVTYDGREFVLVGVGTRKVFGFKVYSMAMYIEDEAARKGFPKLAGQAGGADNETLLKSGLVPGFIIQGEFAKHAILRFARAVSAADQRKSYRESLGDDVTDKATPEVRKAAEAFLALFDEDVKEGEEMAIHTEPDGRVGVELHGKIKWGETNLRVVHDVWDIWLGAKPINADLKTALMSRIDSLAR